MNTAMIPTAVEDLHGDGRWMSIHQRFTTEAKEKEPDVVFIGDSIVSHLAQTELWTKSFAPMHALNFGIGGDTIQNLLWRLMNGELEYMKPKVVVIHVGTNNVLNTAEEVVDGIRTIVDTVCEKLPDAYVVVLTLLPRGQNPNPLRDKNRVVNDMLAKSLTSVPVGGAGSTRTQLVNIDPGFVNPVDGTISHHDLYDYLHLTHSGYQRAFEPVCDLLQQLLSE